MDGSLLSILAAAGLAGAAGHRAFIPALCLGGLHHFAGMSAAPGETPFFALSESFMWLQDPVVLGILGVLTAVEFLAEANPDAPEIVNLAMKLPKLIAGGIVAAAAVGTLDENALLLASSGLLGAGTALGVDTVRAEVKHALDGSMGDATDGVSTKALSVVETGWAVGVSVAAVVLPILVLVAAAVVFFAWRSRRALAEAKMEPCPACDLPRHPAATACPHCKAAIG